MLTSKATLSWIILYPPLQLNSGRIIGLITKKRNYSMTFTIVNRNNRLWCNNVSRVKFWQSVGWGEWKRYRVIFRTARHLQGWLLSQWWTKITSWKYYLIYQYMVVSLMYVWGGRGGGVGVDTGSGSRCMTPNKRKAKARQWCEKCWHVKSPLICLDRSWIHLSLSCIDEFSVWNICQINVTDMRWLSPEQQGGLSVSFSVGSSLAPSAQWNYTVWWV